MQVLFGPSNPLRMSVLAVLLALSVPALCDPIDDGVRLFVSHDYTSAMQVLMPPATEGHTEAQILIGIMYSEGRGVARSRGLAQRWYRQAAHLGDPAGQFLLGLTYLDNPGGPADIRRAFEWIQSAARQGNATAQRFLARSYEKGWMGLRADRQMANHWQAKVDTVN